MADPIEDVADDWQLAALIGIAGAVGGGAGMFFFAIQSQKLNSLEPMIFTAAGVGMGGNASGVPYDTFKDAMTKKSIPFSSVRIQTPFSIRMLHTSAGFYASAGVGYQVASYGWSYLDAGRNGVKFFTSSGAGGAVGSGLGAVALAGTWYSVQAQRQLHQSDPCLPEEPDGFPQRIHRQRGPRNPEHLRRSLKPAPTQPRELDARSGRS